ncbi:hypothetical protein FHS31_001949 [Sphingomonas vulcanisoli]|uniref:Uncharacterized protein n=1 Tax=Sphingomonas vulcanisoli TaxID=1658060 RepID=A0ABX0TS28_9SPHN|nr:hypothetical protein [Sphingomonas vulcanisoli]NIJ08332.1 hypothetical protein [Sphingomonas vulcanisoli]
MFSAVLLTIILVLAAIGVFIAWGMWRHYAEHRTSALLYEGHSLTPPPSTVCPKCRRRAYGRRAIADHYCETCDLHY